MVVIENALWKIRSVLGALAQQQRCILVSKLLLPMAMFFFVTAAAAGIVGICRDHSCSSEVSNGAAGNGDAVTGKQII